MRSERIVHGTPTKRARIQRRLGGIICRRLGHRPMLATRSYLVKTGPAQVIGEARLLGSDQRMPLHGIPVEERSGREVICRRCWAMCGDSLLEEAQ